MKISPFETKAILGRFNVVGNKLPLPSDTSSPFTFPKTNVLQLCDNIPLTSKKSLAVVTS